MEAFPYKNVHLLGIGGAGVSGLARILLELGVNVSGSDREPSQVTEALAKSGARVYYREAASNVADLTDLVVYSAAIKPTHPERRRAAAIGATELKYAQCVALLTGLRNTICIAGTHGKTSTTNLTATVLARAGRNPGWIIGGVPNNLPASGHWDAGQEFVLESCEYDHSFLNYSPTMAVIHNIEPDHLDYFKSFDAMKRAFRSLANRLPTAGVLFANWDDPVVREIAENCRRKVVKYGFHENATYRAENLMLGNGAARFTLSRGRHPLATIHMPAPGRINVSNALAAATVGLWLGVTPENIADTLERPIGVKRRFELVARVKGVPIVDDYAHHPTAVRELAAQARSAFPNHKLTFVFQAHQYARLTGFFDEFAEALSTLDRVIVCRTYAARERLSLIPGEPERQLALLLRSRGVDAVALDTFAEVQEHLRANWHPDMAVFTVGAGNVTRIAQELAENVLGAVPDAGRALGEKRRGCRSPSGLTRKHRHHRHHCAPAAHHDDHRAPACPVPPIAPRAADAGAAQSGRRDSRHPRIRAAFGRPARQRPAIRGRRPPQDGTQPPALAAHHLPYRRSGRALLPRPVRRGGRNRFPHRPRRGLDPSRHRRRLEPPHPRFRRQRPCSRPRPAPGYPARWNWSSRRRRGQTFRRHPVRCDPRFWRD
jgi:UDP-N-acetylmuramate--alanine ligase